MAAEKLRCACCDCGAGNLKRCSRCKCIYYCSVDCQKRDYANHKVACRSRKQQSCQHDKFTTNRGDENDRRRFHPSFVGTKMIGLPVVSGHISREELYRLLMENMCFVWRESGLQSNHNRWTFDYLEKNLPPNEKYGGMIANNDEMIFRFHSSSNNKDTDNRDGGDGNQMKNKNASKSGDGNDGGDAATRTCFTFREFRSTPNAYLQMPLLWRDGIHCKGFKGPIGDVLWDDLRNNMINFSLLSQLRLVPTVYSPFRVLQLFVSHRDHLSYLHFDEQPNLFLQISGRKRWLIFPPEVPLRPFGPNSIRARRSSVDVFEKIDGDDDNLRGAGIEVLLEPGDCLFVPPYWWHHVHTVTEECVSIAIWFFNERLPLPLTAANSKNSESNNCEIKYPINLKLTPEQLLAQSRYQRQADRHK